MCWVNQCHRLILAAGGEFLAIPGRRNRAGIISSHCHRCGGWQGTGHPVATGVGKTCCGLSPPAAGTLASHPGQLRAEHLPTHLTEVPAQPETPRVLPQPPRGEFGGKILLHGAHHATMSCISPSLSPTGMPPVCSPHALDWMKVGCKPVVSWLNWCSWLKTSGPSSTLGWAQQGGDMSPSWPGYPSEWKHQNSTRRHPGASCNTTLGAGNKHAFSPFLK